MVGTVGFVKFSPTHRRAELGYWIGVPFWNQGYVTEAAKALLDYGFDDLWTKPISLEQIIERVSDYLGTRQTDDEQEPQSLAPPASEWQNHARYARVRAEFVDDLPRRLRSLAHAVDQCDWLAAGEMLHQLAGSAGVMGFMPL